MSSRANQKSIYLAPDVERELDELVHKYPKVRLTDVMNVSLRTYLREALQRGIDGNLDPLPPPSKENGHAT